jgi:hypothetical protein
MRRREGWLLVVLAVGLGGCATSSEEQRLRRERLNPTSSSQRCASGRVLTPGVVPAPVVGATVSFFEEERPVATVHTDARGDFEVCLPRDQGQVGENFSEWLRGERGARAPRSQVSEFTFEVTREGYAPRRFARTRLAASGHPEDVVLLVEPLPR